MEHVCGDLAVFDPRFGSEQNRRPLSLTARDFFAIMSTNFAVCRPKDSSSEGLTEGSKLRCPAPITRLRVEKIEGGLMVAGVVVAANCQIILPIFGFLFLLVGCVLTGKAVRLYRAVVPAGSVERFARHCPGEFNAFSSRVAAASYRGPGADEEPDHYAARIAFTGNSRILGPACIVVGFLMTVAGVALCLLTRRARRREQSVGFHCPLHGDFYPLSPVTSSKTVGE